MLYHQEGLQDGRPGMRGCSSPDQSSPGRESGLSSMGVEPGLGLHQGAAAQKWFLYSPFMALRLHLYPLRNSVNRRSHGLVTLCTEHALPSVSPWACSTVTSLSPPPFMDFTPLLDCLSPAQFSQVAGFLSTFTTVSGMA